MGLLSNHLKVIRRNLVRQKFYTVIIILGLTLSISFVYFSFLFVKSELSYDTFHDKKETIYRLYQYEVDKSTGEELDARKSAILPTPLPEELAKNIKDITSFTRYGSVSAVVNINNTSFNETVHAVDESFFEIFSFPVFYATSKSFLSEPNYAAISVEQSKTFFGSESPIDKVIEIDIDGNETPFIVKATFDPRHHESSMNIDIVITMEGLAIPYGQDFLKSYMYASFEAFIVTNEKDLTGLEDLMTSVYSSTYNSENNIRKVNAQPLSDIHLNPDIMGNLGTTSPLKLWIFTGLALLIIIVAIINFITLSIGHTLNRIREMGLRKTLGSRRNQLRGMLILESTLLTTIASVLAIILTLAFLSDLNNILNTQLIRVFSLSDIIFFLLLIITISIASGFSKSESVVQYSTIQSIRGNLMSFGGKNWLSSSLVVLQFSISLFLIIGTITIRSQLQYIQKKDLGFDQERLIEIDLINANTVQSKRAIDVYKRKVLENPGIVSASASMNSFTEPWTELGFLQEDETDIKINFNLVDEGYISAMGLELKLGEGFDVGANSSNSIIINETLANEMGWTAPLSEQIPGKNFEKNHQIIGVVKDFHFGTLHNSIEPLILTMNDGSISDGITGLLTYVWPPKYYRVLVRVGPGDLGEYISFLEEKWEELYPQYPFNYNFVDNVLAQNYAEDQRWGDIIDISAILSIAIAWLGLIGLMRLTIQKRTKEIGIRRVLGSSPIDVGFKLSKKFFFMMVISFVIALLFSWYFLNEWLLKFSYRINLSPGIFLLAALAAFIMIMLSIIIQVRSISTQNPVKSLRSE